MSINGVYVDVEKKISDEELFKQPPPAKEDCPICFLILPTMRSGRRYKTCCGKTICSGCIHAPRYDDQGNEVDNKICPFCRIPTPYTDEEAIEREKKRLEADDPIAIYNQGVCYEQGSDGYPQNYDKALELYCRAAELGHIDAYCNIGSAYIYGRGVEIDIKKASHYWELAAMRGEVVARHNLGIDEARAGNMDRALKHYMIAVRSGLSDSLKTIKLLYSNGHAIKDTYTKALRLYQEYLSEIKSPQREEAAAFSKELYRYY